MFELAWYSHAQPDPGARVPHTLHRQGTLLFSSPAKQTLSRRTARNYQACLPAIHYKLKPPLLQPDLSPAHAHPRGSLLIFEESQGAEKEGTAWRK